MSITRPNSPTKQMLDYWKAKKVQMNAAQQSPQEALMSTNLVLAARFMREMTTKTVEERAKVALIDQALEKFSQDCTQLNLRINTFKNLVNGYIDKSEDHLKKVAGRDLSEKEVLKLRSIIKSFSEKQNKQLDSLQDDIIGIKMLAPGMLEKDFESNHKRLEKASAKLSKIFNMVLTSNSWALDRAHKHLYTRTLGIKVKEVIANPQRNSAARSPEEVKKAQQKSLKRLMDKIIGYASQPDNSSFSKYLKNKIFQHQPKFKELINLEARSKNSLYWEQPQALYQFLNLITKDNLSAYIKAQNLGRKTAKNSLADAKRDFMDKNGFKTGADQLEVMKLANALFDGDKGQKMKKSLRQILLRYAIYNGLLDMVSKNSLVEREQAFTNLYDEICQTSEGLKAWQVFFEDHARLNLGPRFTKDGKPVGSDTLWAFREALAAEKHPLFEILQEKVNGLYHSFKGYSKLEIQLPSVTASPVSTQPSTPTSSHRSSFFSSMKSATAFQAEQEKSLHENSLANNEREGSIFYLS